MRTDTASGERPQQVRREVLAVSRLDEGVGTTVDCEPSFAVAGTDELHPVVDAQVGGLSLVGLPLGTVTDDGRAPLAVPEFREAQKEALDVCALV